MGKRLWFLLIGLMLLGHGYSMSDMWANFHSESVTSFGCKVMDTMITQNGKPTDEVVWQATAFADHAKFRWSMEVGRYAYTLKGRHQAEHACTKWQDEAEKRVKAARQ